MPREDDEFQGEKELENGKLPPGDEDESNGDPDEVEDLGESAAEGDGSEAEGEPEEVDFQPQPQRKPSRGESRFQRLANEARQAREDAARAAREAQELRAEMARHRAAVQQETPEQEQARIALMTPEERIEYRLAKAEKRNEEQLRVLAFQTQDQMDRAAFNALAVTNPFAKKYADKVEAMLADLRSKGQSVPRESLLKFVLGEEMMNKRASGEVQRQKDAGAQRVQRAQAKPTNGKGDAAPRRGQVSEQEARRKRLENVTF